MSTKVHDCLVACKSAEVQSPRDLTSQAEGDRTPKAATLTKAQADDLPPTNVHYHLGAEHKSEDFSDDADTLAFLHADPKEESSLIDMSLAKGHSKHVRPGFMCTNKGLTSEQLAEYDFKNGKCKGEVEVGKSYEVHYVRSSAGYSPEMLEGVNDDGIDDGLGGAATGRGQLNPMIVVQAQVFQIVNGGDNLNDMHKFSYSLALNNTVMYPGSTTGTGFTNEICSPYAITWHVDKKCHQVSPESFEKFCEQLDSFDIVKDLAPHGSRMLVKKEWVVPWKYVKDLA